MVGFHPDLSVESIYRQDVSQAKFPRKFGKYHLLGPLAQGGMGALYLAVTGDRGLERLLVIKTVLPHLADDEYIARFRDEAKVVVKLSHGNLVPVFDAGQADGEIFMAMEFVEGKDLRAVWNRCAKKGVAFPVELAVFMAKELCRGLGYAHAFGNINLVHRDVSPPNVLISYSGEIKLTDFGLAFSTLKLEKTAPGIVYGKVAYMSPEQARGDALDGRSDLYAAAIILWELLTGRQLFPPGEDQPQALIERARDPEVTPPSQRAPRVPPELDAICVKALAADPDKRYRTGEELRDALGEWLATYAPGTDAASLERFLHELFAEDIVAEREERQALVEKTRERVKTLPPTDELRQIVEKATGAFPIEEAGKGRRASDSDDDGDRRLGDRRRGRVVNVPSPGPGGQTVVSTPDGMSAATAAQLDTDTAPAKSDFLGNILDDRYEILELIGEGGMGRVYLAEHVDIGRRVAVKVLHRVYGGMPELVERFRREARAASKIGHPHIVDVTDSGQTADGSAYFVMEYLEGVELANVIDREGALDIHRALRIVTQICRALAAAHQAGIIHRDLKPENVFLTVREGSSDFVKVLDFGIAKSTEAEEARAKKLTHPGMAMGTPEYMAPEQAAGRTADQRCDVYAVGAILYEMLTGVAPYQGDNFMEILTKKATVDPTPVRELRPEIPVAVDDLVMQSMARNPDDRPPSMESLEYELTKCLSGRGAAVAKILGMRALANRTQEPPDSSPPEARNERKRPATGSEAADTVPTSATPVSNATGNLPAIDVGGVPDVRGGTLGIVGWVALGLLIAGGVGAVMFVAGGEKAARDNGSAMGVLDAASAESEDVKRDKTSERSDKNRDHRKDSTPSVTVDAGAIDGKDDGKDNGKDRSVDDGDPRPRVRASGKLDQKGAKRVLGEANKAANRGDFKTAEELYEQVRSSKFFTSDAILGLAEVAFQRKDHKTAVALTEKILTSQAGGMRARKMYARALYRDGQLQVALQQCKMVLKRNPTDKEMLGLKKTIEAKLE